MLPLVSDPIRVGIVGATGYLGQETLRILAQHPRVRIQALASSSAVGKKLGDVLPPFRGVLPDAPAFQPVAPATFAGCDVVFSAAPHGVAKDLAPALLAQGNRVIDLSGDHRLAGSAAEAHYGKAAAAAHAVYGLPEKDRAAIATAKLLANPGCYPTASALAALPLVEAGLVAPRVIVDAKSGVSGAGREASAAYHYPEANESVRAYKVGEHRHEPEIAQTLGLPVTFTPHLVPMNRGILATVYLFPHGPALTQGEIESLYAKRYASEPFVRVVPDEPDTKHVQRTNFCDVRPHVTPSGTYVVTSAIDNLVKGGAGQAVQNLNVMFGLPETLGLPVIGGGP